MIGRALKLMSRRRWFRFRLRTVLVVTALFGMPLGILSRRLNHLRTQRAIVAEIQAYGGRVSYDWESDLEVYFRVTANDSADWEDPPGPAWLRKCFGNDLFANVSYVWLSYHTAQPVPHTDKTRCLNQLADFGDLKHLLLDGDDVRNDDLQPIGRLTNLTDLYLTNTSITDEGLVHLGKLPRLAYLRLGRCKIRGKGLEQLSRLPSLYHLDLRGVEITDDDIDAIVSLQSLDLLTIDSTQLRPEGATRLRRAMPNCTVQID